MFNMAAQIFGEPVGDGGGAACQQQLHAHRATHNIRRANDDRIQTVGVDVVTFKQGYNAAWGTRTQAWRTLAQATDVIRVETVNVFIRRNTLQHFNVVDTRR